MHLVSVCHQDSKASKHLLASVWSADAATPIKPVSSEVPSVGNGEDFSPQTFPDGLIKTQFWLEKCSLIVTVPLRATLSETEGVETKDLFLSLLFFARPDLTCIWTLKMAGKSSEKGQRFSVDVNNVILDLKQFRNCVCADDGQLSFPCPYSLGSMARDYLSQLWWAC